MSGERYQPNPVPFDIKRLPEYLQRELRRIGDLFGGSLQGSATYDPANLADGAGATTTITVTGAQLGDFVIASFSLDLQGVLLTAWVSSANTVSIRFQNESGGAVDLASGTLRVRVYRR